MTDFYDISLALTAVLMLVALGWSVSLRRRVREQTRQIRLQAERETALNEKYRELFEQANDMVFSHDVSGKFTSVNKAGERILGCARERVLGMRISEFVEPSQIKKVETWLDQCAQGEVTPLELEIVGRTQSRSILEISARLVRSDGKTISVEGIARDVTEKKKAEEALRQSEQRFSSAFRVSPVAIGICTLSESRFVDINESFLRLFGFTRDEVVGRTATDLAIWDNAEDRATVEKSFSSQHSICGAEFKFRMKSGGSRTALLFAERIELGITPCALVLMYDITERLNLESELRKALKMEAIGRLAAGVAHDFNNLLTVIQGNLHLVRAKNNGNVELHQPLDRIEQASERAANLTQQLLTFSRKQNLQRKPLDLNDVINNGIKMFKHLLREDINLRLKFASRLPMVNADPTMVDQVIMNLVVNARDAMDTGGDLIVSTAPVEIKTAYLKTHPGAIDGRFVCLGVTDTGCGMDDATKSRIFEPFFTTKASGKGTGLGLATVYGIVKQHEGWIEVESEVGQGTTFKIYFPTDNALPAPETVPMEPSDDGKTTILVVEDEAFVAELVRNVLEEQGYRILEADNGLVAQQIWNDHHGRIDLLLTDIKMPHGMSGTELASNLRALKPDPKVLYTSGFSPDPVSMDSLTGERSKLLPKPYSPAKLIETVRGMIDRV
jgi:PAS domain S-box-containing protein